MPANPCMPCAGGAQTDAQEIVVPPDEASAPDTSGFFSRPLSSQAPVPQASVPESSGFFSRPAAPVSPRSRPSKTNKMYPSSSCGITQETTQFFCLFFLYLSVIPFLFVFFYHAVPSTILSIVAIVALCAFIPCVFNKGDLVVSEPIGPLLSATMLASTMVVFLGSMHIYWAHVQPLRALTTAREYNGVYPQLPSVAFRDAAFLTFAGNSSIDVSKTVSTKSLDAGLHTFCAAPVTNAQSVGRVEFWAIGVDCCSTEPGNVKFECDDAATAGAHYAYVMQDPSDPLFDILGKYVAPARIRRDIFKQAIAKADLTLGTSSAEEPLLVRWTASSKEDIISREVQHIVFKCVFVNIMMSACMALYLTHLVHRFGELRKMHRRDQFGTAVGGEGVSAQLNELLHSMDENFDDVAENSIKILSESHRAKLQEPISRVGICVWNVAIPFLVCQTCMLLTSFSGCWTHGRSVYAAFLIVLSIVLVAMLSTPSKVVNGMFLIFLSMVGLYIGHLNYSSNMFHYCSIGDRRSYSSVPVDAQGDTYRDAGMLKFESTSQLSQNFSVGFLHSGVTFCVAPIISSDNSCEETLPKAASPAATTTAEAPAPAAAAKADSFLQRTSSRRARMKTSVEVDDDDDATDLDLDREHATGSFQQLVAAPAKCKPVKRVEFWAIGTNCCRARKEFGCDGGKDMNAHSAVQVRATGNEDPTDDRHQFLNAVAQAAAAYDLPAPSSPMLIRWGKDPEVLQSDYMQKAIGVIMLTAIIGFLSNLGIGIATFFYMKKQRNRLLKEEAEQKRKEEEAAAQATHPIVGFFQKARSQLNV